MPETHRQPRVKDMDNSLHFGMRMKGFIADAHILQTTYPSPGLAYCGVRVYEWPREFIGAADVCRKCLRATEKYA